MNFDFQAIMVLALLVTGVIWALDACVLRPRREGAAATLAQRGGMEGSEEKVAHQVLRLIERLEDLDDVQNVYTNADFPEEFAASYE